jgi:hypothetical protein
MIVLNLGGLFLLVSKFSTDAQKTVFCTPEGQIVTAHHFIRAAPTAEERNRYTVISIDRYSVQFEDHEGIFLKEDIEADIAQKVDEGVLTYAQAEAIGRTYRTLYAEVLATPRRPTSLEDKSPALTGRSWHPLAWAPM